MRRQLKGTPASGQREKHKLRRLDLDSLKAKVDSTHQKLKAWYRLTKDQVTDEFLKLEARLKEQRRRVLQELDRMARHSTARVRRFN